LEEVVKAFGAGGSEFICAGFTTSCTVLTGVGCSIIEVSDESTVGYSGTGLFGWISPESH